LGFRLAFSANHPFERRWYKDSDKDGYSDGTAVTSVDRPQGYRLEQELTAICGDCDDNNAAVNPDLENFNPDKLPCGTYTNSLGMKFSVIPAGTVMTDGQPNGLKYTLPRFIYMMTTEVTYGQWKAVTGSDYYYYHYGFVNGCPDCPLLVNMDDFERFMSMMNCKGEGNYYLPTDKIWLYAAQAGNSTPFANSGSTATVDGTTGCQTDSSLNAIGWYCGNAEGTAHPVGQKQPNAFGLYDMYGNEWELVHESWESVQEPWRVPFDLDYSDPNSLMNYLLLGGNWNSTAAECQSLKWLDYNENLFDEFFGFRLIRIPPLTHYGVSAP
jgi:formylglycine-generating enzyme required for sulfatase activity